jgi:acyl carrier protein
MGSRVGSMMKHIQVVRDPFERSAIFATVVATLQDLMRDWEVEEPIGSETCVVADLGFESIDLIQMVAALEQAFRPRRISFVDMLVAEGRYVDDLSVSEIVDGIEMRIRESAEK